MGRDVQAILTIALTDLALQLDNALAISSVAGAMHPSQRLLALAAGVGLAALCLFGLTAVGSALVERAAVLRPVAGAVLVLIGLQLIASFFHLRVPLPWRL